MLKQIKQEDKEKSKTIWYHIVFFLIDLLSSDYYEAGTDYKNIKRGDFLFGNFYFNDLFLRYVK